MNRFLQLHYLTIYPLSNPNRDDLGRPKSATYGGVPRLRISSQALKRAARQSDVMQDGLEGHFGERTRRIGEVIRETLMAEVIDEDKAADLAEEFVKVFGTLDKNAKKKGDICTSEMVFISPAEKACAIDFARKAAAGEPLPGIEELKKEVLRIADGAVDIAMFGRMLAGAPSFNREAAVQVSHALTTHQALVEEDFYTAVDDLKRPSEDDDAGAGFVGTAGFGSGVFYTYACVNAALLKENLDGDADLAGRAAGALVEALATATPSGKRNSFGHQTFANYIRVEQGSHQPRSLAGAFFTPVTGENLLRASVQALSDTAQQMDDAYGLCADAMVEMNVVEGVGTLSEIKEFATAAMKNV